MPFATHVLAALLFLFLAQVARPAKCLAQSRSLAEVPGASPIIESLAQASPMPASRGETRSESPDKPARPVAEQPRRDVDAKPTDPPATAPTEVTSPAERIARLRRSLESDTQRLDELRMSVVSAVSEYATAEEEFQSIERKVQDLKMRLAAARENKDVESENMLDVGLTDAQASWQQSKRRFEKAIGAQDGE